MNHPHRCWLLPGHEQCALQAAEDLTKTRAAWVRGYEAGERLHRPTKPKRRQGGQRTLTPEQCQEIRDLYGVNGGVVGLVTMRQLAAFYKVSYTTVFNVLHAAEVAA
jgi:hypothetical protein